MTKEPEVVSPPAEEREEIGRRIEQARERLRQTIPPPEDPDPPQT